MNLHIFLSQYSLIKPTIWMNELGHRNKDEQQFEVLLKRKE